MTYHGHSIEDIELMFQVLTEADVRISHDSAEAFRQGYQQALKDVRDEIEKSMTEPLSAHPNSFSQYYSVIPPKPPITIMVKKEK